VSGKQPPIPGSDEEPIPVNLMKWRKAIRHPSGPRSATVRHVLLTLATWAGSDGREMFPSIETLSVATRLHRETVRRALEEAWSEGWVIRTQRPARDPRAHWSYEYAAAAPAGFVREHGTDVGDRWDTNPVFTSERRNRPRTKQGRNAASVPAQDRDEGAPSRVSSRSSVESVPVVSGERPCPGSISSLSSVESVPVQDSRTSSSEVITEEESLNTSLEGALTRTRAREPKSVDREEQLRKSIGAEIRLLAAQGLKQHAIASAIGVHIDIVLRELREVNS
jgi:hypothetical protein